MESSPASRVDPSPPRQSKPFFFWLVLVMGVGFFALLARETVNAFRYSMFTREPGWTAGPVKGRWIVRDVDADGPAAGRLSRGDEVLAIDGDRRVAGIGPDWKLQDARPGPYTLEVRSGAGTRLVPLNLRFQPAPGYLAWVFIYLGAAFSFYGVGMLMGLARPESRLIQYGFATSLLNSALMLGEAVHALGGIRSDPTVFALLSVFPLNFTAGYLFFRAFPFPAVEERRWRYVFWAIVVLGVGLWIPRSSLNLLRALGPETALAVLDRHAALLRGYYAVIQPTEFLYAVGVTFSIFAVLRRNDRRLPEGTDRRRIRLVLWSQVLALLPVFVAAIAVGAQTLLGFGGELAAAVETGKKAANAFVMLSPIALGYAVLKHRVLGFRVFVRLGLQYLLARNVLRVVMVLPGLWLGYTVVAHPDRTLGELLFSGGSRLNLIVIALAALGLRFRAPLAAAIDKRFFRESYDQQQILLRLIEAVKQRDSIREISEMVGREIDAALHVTRVVVLYRNPQDRGFSIEYSSKDAARELRLPGTSPLLRELGRSAAARTRDELRPHASEEESAWLDQLDVHLLVPIHGIDQDLVGVLMLGEKRSEEPFVSRDKSLLQLLAAQIGGVYEVLTLRGEVGRHRRLQTEVLARFDAQQINLVKECPVCGTCHDSSAERCDRDGNELVLSLPIERSVDGKYRLERLIGRGGMGAVYEASDLRLNRRVAVKVMTGRFISSGAALRRFAREAQACARLEHPRIVRVYDYGTLGDDAAYLVMEYVQGASWRVELQRRGAFAPPLAAELLDQVLDGIEAAHAGGVLHRDLKPENLLISPATGGRVTEVKILDFGLAKVRELSFADPKSLTNTGVTMGTFGYMSPEQFAGEDVDERSDVYSLGVIALETLTGRVAFEGQFFHRTIASELERRLMSPARSDAQRRLAQAIESCLAYARSSRLASAAEARSALIPAIRGCEELPLPPPVGGVSTLADTSSPTAHRPASSRPPR